MHQKDLLIQPMENQSRVRYTNSGSAFIINFKKCIIYHAAFLPSGNYLLRALITGNLGLFGYVVIIM